MAFIIFIFFVAAAISTVAAYFSLVGLGSIFAATFWGVVIMGASLEVGKIVTAKWIHANWRNPAAPLYFRGLLCFFVACLMAITSLGVYGYLSKGHLEQQAPLAGLGIQVAQLETQLKQKQDENVRLESRLGQISKITDKVLEGNARAGLRASNQSKKEAAAIQKTIDANNSTINDITQKLVPLKMKTGDVEGELGVAKFIAEALGMAPEKAIRIIISLIMAAFDPLAIAMFIMGSISLQKRKEDKAKAVKVETVVIPEPLVPVQEILEQIKEDEMDLNKINYPHTRSVEEESELRHNARQEIYKSFEKPNGEPMTFQSTPGRMLQLDEDYKPIYEPIEIKEEAKVAIADSDTTELVEQLEREKQALQEREAQIREMEDHLSELKDIQEKTLADLDARHAALEQQKADFSEEMEDVKHLLAEVSDLDETKRLIAQDHAALSGAHKELLELESRLNDERELLQQWQDQVTEQQNAINRWTPSDGDTRSDKEKILEMLERNPQVVNEIISTVDAMRHVVKPGL